METNNFYTYLYLRNKNSVHGLKGTPYYVGKGTGNRCFNNKRHRKLAVPKDDKFIMFWTYGISEEDAFRDEIFLIDFYGRLDLGTGCLQNRTAGGDGSSGYKHTPEARAKISSSKKGKIFSAEHRAKLSAANKGKTFSAEHRAKMSAANKGKTHSAETRAKMSAAKEGKILSSETRAKMSASHKDKQC
jgi:hypothetical protein